MSWMGMRVAVLVALFVLASAGDTGAGTATARFPKLPLCGSSGERGSDAAIYRTIVGCVGLSRRVYANHPGTGKRHRALVIRAGGRTKYWHHVPLRVRAPLPDAQLECDGGRFVVYAGRRGLPLYVYREFTWCFVEGEQIVDDHVCAVVKIVVRERRVTRLVNISTFVGEAPGCGMLASK
jgi:hypothetical protein